MRIASVLVLFAAIEAACSSGGPLNVRATDTDSATVPRPFIQHVASQWKGATVTARAASPCAPSTSGSGTVAADAPRAFLAGDFDGDGANDVAAPVQRADGIHLVAGLQHTYGYTVLDVTDKADASADRFTVRTRGSMYKVPGSDVDYYFGTDTIVLVPCSGTPTAYLWNGQGFDAQPLAK